MEPPIGTGRVYPNPRVVTQHGRTVRLYDDLLRDRLVVIQFAYTTCTGSCPSTAARLVEVRRLLDDELRREVRFLTFTLDPERDGPAELRAYAERIGAGEGWTFVTGARADLRTIRRFFGLRERDPALDEDPRQHAATLVVGDVARDRWATMAALARSVRIADLVRRTAGRRAGRQGMAGSAAAAGP